MVHTHLIYYYFTAHTHYIVSLDSERVLIVGVCLSTELGVCCRQVTAMARPRL